MKNKAKIVLISPYEEISVNGLRVISSYLKQHGHEVKLVFLSKPHSKFSDTFSKTVLNDLISFCESSDLIGFTLMTNYFVKVRELSLGIKKKVNIPIIWGGIHPTVRPEECLEYADMVCIGEGEQAMLELADRIGCSQDLSNVKNIWFNKNSTILRNEVRTLEEDLDKYPFQDYDYDTHYILRSNRILKMDERLLEEAMPHSGATGKVNVEYQIITTRNCPHNCAYCVNNALRRIYEKKGKFVRKRSPENIILEIESIKNRFDFIKQILIVDDTFFIRNEDEVKKFCDYYKQRINLPMRCYTSPLETNENKLRLMIDAGLFRVSLGVQSYFDRTLADIYKRPTSRSAISESIGIISKYKANLTKPTFHIIVDNPYESIESKKENIKFTLSLPQGSRIALFPLTLFPGTELYERAKNDGIINNEIEEIYLKGWLIDDIHKLDYLTYILYACKWLKSKDKPLKFNLDKVMLFLIRDEMIFLLDNKAFLSLIFILRKIMKTKSHLGGLLQKKWTQS